MNKLKRIALLGVSLNLLMTTAGCWNYVEIEDMSVVAGVAIDKEKDGNLSLTTEIVDTKEGTQSGETGFKMLSLTGKTMFDIVRGMISVTGKKLYWSHAKAIILSEEIAREGVIKVIDWYNRDTETRSDVYIFVSKEKTAKEVINLSSLTNTIMTYAIADQMDAEKNVSTAPVVQLWDFIDKLEASGEYAMAPLIYIHETNGIKNARISGTAIFTMDKMIGTINGDETKYMLFAKNKIKGGVLVVNSYDGKPGFSLEILSNTTKIKPVWVEGKLQIQINTLTYTGLDEVNDPEEFYNRKSKNVIEKRAEKELAKNILSVIHKVQSSYHADIFGFGELIHEQMPKTWKKLEQNWGREFTDLDVVVNSRIIIKSSAQTSRSIRIQQKDD